MRDLNFKCLAGGKRAIASAPFGPDGLAMCAPNRAREGADEVFQWVYLEPV